MGEWGAWGYGDNCPGALQARSRADHRKLRMREELVPPLPHCPQKFYSNSCPQHPNAAHEAFPAVIPNPSLWRNTTKTQLWVILEVYSCCPLSTGAGASPWCS